MKKKPPDIINLHLHTINENHMMYGSWDMECDRMFCHFGLVFALLPHINPENQNFKMHEDVIIIHRWKFYDVWFLRYGGQWQNVLSFWAIFGPLTQPTTLKINIWKNVKNARRYYPFTHVYQKWRLYDVSFLKYKAQQSFLSFWALFSTDPPNNSKNQSVPKIMIIC